MHFGSKLHKTMDEKEDNDPNSSLVSHSRFIYGKPVETQQAISLQLYEKHSGMKLFLV